MFKSILKTGIKINALVLAFGYINSKRKYKHEFDPNEFRSKFDYQAFKTKFEDFKKNHPEILNYISPSREETIHKLNTEQFDLLIIGGGCSGAGVCIEGHQRNLKCGLIESNDFASGTSSRSTKLLHGGVRYLQDALGLTSSDRLEKISLVFQALRERDYVIKSLPYMNNIIDIQIKASSLLYLNYYYIGLFIYHSLYTISNYMIPSTFPWPRINIKDRAINFFEGQFFDSRQNILSILSCVRTGAACSNYIEFNEYIYDNNGKIKGVRAKDRLSNKEIIIKSEVVVNCTGIYTDDNLNKEDLLMGKLITSSRGTHLVFKKELFNKIGINSGYMLPETKDGRILFILPYQKDYYLVGTTDNEMAKTSTPKPAEEDINLIINELTTNLNLTDHEIKSSLTSQWAGLRPLVRNPDNYNEAKSLSRNHVIRYDNNTGLISLMGGKWTTYREMGEDLIKHLETNNEYIRNKSRQRANFYNSQTNKLSGAIHQDNLNVDLNFSEEKKFYINLEEFLIKEYSISKEISENLIFKYGLNAIKILDLYNADKSKDILKSEIIYSIRNEMVAKPNDFLCRRSGLAFVNRDKAYDLIDYVSDIIAKELKWSKEKLKNEKIEAKDNFKYLI